MKKVFLIIACCFLFGCSGQQEKKADKGPRRIEILLLGHDSEHHNSALYMPMLASALAKDGINFSYTDRLEDLNPEMLAKYDGLMIYANHEKITPSQEAALLDFVAAGGGFIPVHCASYCFQNSSEYIDLVGGQFLEHDTATFTAALIKKDHPALQSVEAFSTWDETYVHTKLSDDITVLMERVAGDHREPWTWVKKYGEGRVYYTAYGHDERTWGNPGFHKLIKQGILWAVGDKVKGQWQDFMKEMPELVYKKVPNIPNYEERVPPPQYQEPLSPEESKKLIQVPAGFELKLFAAEPDIVNPVAMDWDERGRLWVIETVDYPNTVRNQKGMGDDRIKICEDTDGDGKADKFTVFADDLNIPTSLVFVNGGIIVAQAPHFLFLRDTDGDDKADVRKVIIDGWGTFDTHAGPSNLQYGIDNKIYGAVGYSGFEGTIAGENLEFGQGIYRFAPDVSTFEVLTGTSNNTWGLGLTEDNSVFASTANNTHSVFVGIFDEVFEGVEGIPTDGSIKIDGHYAMHPVTGKVRQVDVFGGFTAASGHNFYTARAYPENYWNQVAFVCEPTGHLVHMARIRKNGSGFVEEDGWNLLASADEWVAPVEAKVGPDGAVWVLDWYNFIVQHNPTPTPERGGYAAETGEGNAYINPLRDRTHGRVWRVVYKEAEPYAPITLDKDNPEALVETLGHENMFWRLTAQRLLVERRKTDVLSGLYALVKNQERNALGFNPAALHALWTLEGLGILDTNEEALAVVREALGHPAPDVRKAAIQLLAKKPWAYDAMRQQRIFQDDDPGVRLAAILSLVKMEPSKDIGEMLVNLSQTEEVKKDSWLSRAVYAAASQHRTGFIASFMEKHPEFEDRPDNKPTRESGGFDDAHWKTMELPQMIEAAGLELDGVIWFRKTVTVPGTVVNQDNKISLGPIDDADITYINGTKVGEEDSWEKPRVYPVPAGTLKPGKNVISIRVEDTGGGGGIYGAPEQMFIHTSGHKIPLQGEWKYEVTKNYSGRNDNLFQDAALAEVFVKNYIDKPAITENQTTGAEEGTIIHLKTVKNEMKYDLTEFVVEAGKPVVIVFENVDFMQHNVVITKPGEKETVGKAADKLAADPEGAAKNYIPDLPEVLFSTKLIDPEESVRLRFIAPQKAGSYPYICTFPGHWTLMQGTMKVVEGNKST